MLRRKKKKNFNLPLTPLIDIFSILVIFLITGTYFAPASIEMPDDLDLPNSKSTESLEVATQVVISRSRVSIPDLKYSLPLKSFQSLEGSKISDFQAQISGLVEKIPASQRQNGVTVNLVADKSLPYSLVYNVIQAARVKNVDNVLFVASGE